MGTHGTGAFPLQCGFAYNSEQVCGRYRHFPKLERSTAVEVRTADGRQFRTTYGKAMDWANRPLPAQKR